MPAAGSLATLMKEWPLNSVTLSTVTHSKLRKVLDGIGTQVATCMINRWTVKMNGVEGHITIEVSQWGGIVVRRTLESSDREAPENREEEESILGHNPRISIYPSSTPLTISLLHDPVRPLKKPSLRPSSWAHFFTKFIVLGLLRLDSLTSTVKDLPNQDPIIGVVCGKNLCVSENDNRTWRDRTPIEQAPISLSQPDPSNRVISQTLSMAGRRKRKVSGRVRKHHANQQKPYPCG